MRRKAMKAIKIQNSKGIIVLTYSEVANHWDLFHSDAEAVNDAREQAVDMGWVYDPAKKNYFSNYLAENKTLFGETETVEVENPFSYVDSLVIEKNPIRYLDRKNLENLVGRKIKWHADMYKHNIGYYGRGKDGGICIIKSLDFKNRKPILDAEIIEGADIRFAFFDGFEPSFIAYSDSDRLITFELCE
jgi:hypothetical protein